MHYFYSKYRVKNEETRPTIPPYHTLWGRSHKPIHPSQKRNNLIIPYSTTDRVRTISRTRLMNQNLRWFSGCSARYNSTKTHTVNLAVHTTRPEARQIHSSSVVGANAFHPSPACIPPILSVSANAFRT
jgi:hypothetical protein